MGRLVSSPRVFYLGGGPRIPPGGFTSGGQLVSSSIGFYSNEWLVNTSTAAFLGGDP